MKLDDRHVFSKSFEVGKKGEGLVFHAFTKLGYQCSETPGREAQGLGIDGVMMWGSRGRVSVEIKACQHVHRTGNMFFDVWVVSKDGSKTPGWPYTCTAQLLIYFSTETRACWMLDMLALKNKMKAFRERYREVEVKNRKDGIEYHGLGIPVPAVLVEKECGAKKIWI